MSDPNQTPTASSYSDPIYDRLEGFFWGLARRWGLVIIAVVVAAVLAVILRNITKRTPDADALFRIQQAFKKKESGETLKELMVIVEDAKVPPEFRAQAANLAADDLANGQKYEEARKLLERGLTWAKEVRQPSLELGIQLGIGHMLESSGAYSEAMAIFTKVEAQGSRKLGDEFGLSRNLGAPYVAAATLGLARCHLALAEAKEKELGKIEDATAKKLVMDAAADLRRKAADLFKDLSTRTRHEGSQYLETMADYQHQTLRLAHPEVFPAAEVPAPVAPAPDASGILAVPVKIKPASSAPLLVPALGASNPAVIPAPAASSLPPASAVSVPPTASPATGPVRN